MFRIPRVPLWLLAVLALLLQVDAVVKSTVMTAAPEAACGMVGMEAESRMAGRSTLSSAGRARPAPVKGQAHAQCPYCAVAAQAPLSAAPVLVRPACAVGFAAFRAASASGPRGPPAVRPRARGPPLPA